MGARKRRVDGRGRLSSIDLLPDAAHEAVVWAKRELTSRDRTQLDILEEFNQRLAEIDPTIKPISQSAFNRHSLGISIMARRLQERREMSAILVERFGPEASDDLTIMAAECLKTLIFELLGEAGEAGMAPIEAMRLATALKQATQAQQVSSDRRVRLQAEFHKNAVEAIEEVAKAKGIAAPTVADLKAAFLGIKFVEADS
ncbi:MAG: DUF3486 family protein, partial [Rhizobiales bacterium]|nr:DUF3486 family protein [Hyphomicrobiales bacterium]